MLRTFIRIVVLASLLTACAHRGAVRVNCEGPLRPINHPFEAQPPVTVVPASDAPTPGSEKQP